MVAIVNGLADEKRLTLSAGAFLVVAPWALAGLRSRDLPLFTLAAGLILFLALFSGRAGGGAAVRQTWPWGAGDAFFWAGSLFLLYLGIQWSNAGRVLYFDVEFDRWNYSAPRNPGWPWAFTRDEALEMVYWFFPAWVLGVAMRAPCLTRQGVAQIARWVVYGGGVLAVFGIIQYTSKTKALYWIIPLKCQFFASFAYSNHAAAYFVMVAALAAGLLFREVLRPSSIRNRGRAWTLGTAMVLCLAGANLSLSRAGVILAWLLAMFIAGYGLFRGWRWLRPVTRLNAVVATVAVAAVLFFAVSGFGRVDIRREFEVKHAPLCQMIPGLAGLNLDLSVRPMLWKAGWDVFRADPVYGVGGWGFRYLAAFHMTPENQQALRRNRGWANVHNDPLQFIAEFGMVGVGLMLLALSVLIVACLRRHAGNGLVRAMTCAGLTLVVVFSLIDLPFRCPAILWTWVALLALLPRIGGSGSGAPARGCAACA